MSFWSEASPVTKAAVVLGPVLILVAAYFAFGGEDVEGTTQQRGLAPAAASE